MASELQFPGTAASLSNAGTSENAEAWVNPSNALADDTSEATITAATYDSPDISQLLVVSNFGFAVPAGATITGIVVEIMRRNSAGAASDNRVQLAKGTTFADLVGNNKADTALDWPTAEANKSYGASNDLWGTTWTPTEVNASSFAVFLSVQADAANTDIQVDHIKVTVHYGDTALAGSSAGVGGASSSITTEIRAAGSTAGVGGASSSLTTEIRLAAAVAGTGDAAAGLTTEIRFAGTSAGVADAVASMSSLVASSPGSSGAAAVLTTEVRMAGAAAGAADASAGITTVIALAGTSAGVASALASLATEIRMAAAAAGQGGGQGALTTEILLAAAAAASSGAAGVVTTEIRVAGAAPGQAGAVGVLTVEGAAALLAGTAAGSSDAIGALATAITLAGDSAASSGASGTLTLPTAAQLLAIAAMTELGTWRQACIHLRGRAADQLANSSHLNRLMRRGRGLLYEAAADWLEETYG